MPIYTKRRELCRQQTIGENTCQVRENWNASRMPTKRVAGWSNRGRGLTAKSLDQL
jgi:hypothetical protein